MAARAVESIAKRPRPEKLNPAGCPARITKCLVAGVGAPVYAWYIAAQIKSATSGACGAVFFCFVPSARQENP